MLVTSPTKGAATALHLATCAMERAPTVAMAYLNVVHAAHTGSRSAPAFPLNSLVWSFLGLSLGWPRYSASSMDPGKLSRQSPFWAKAGVPRIPRVVVYPPT